MKILVTGGAGFIGSHLVDALIEKGHQVAVVDDLSTGRKENLNSKAGFYQLGIRDEKLAEVFSEEKPQAVFHLAAQIDVRKSVADPVWDAEINILGSLKVLENCQRAGVKKVIFASTAATYGDTTSLPTPEDCSPQPASPYGIAKLTIEYYLRYFWQVFKVPYVVLRYANVYGPRQNSQGEAGVVAIFCDKLLKGQQPVINGDGRQTRDYIYVADVVAANLLALNSDKVGIFNISTGVETDVNEIAGLIKINIETAIEFTHGPAKEGEQQKSCLDSTKVREELGWRPEIKLAEGIKKTVEWFKAVNKITL